MIEPLRIADHISDYSPLELERFVMASYLRSGSLLPTAFGCSEDAVNENIRLAKEYEACIGPRTGREILDASEKLGRHFTWHWIQERKDSL